MGKNTKKFVKKNLIEPDKSIKLKFQNYFKTLKETLLV